MVFHVFWKQQYPDRERYPDFEKYYTDKTSMGRILKNVYQYKADFEGAGLVLV